ncbi:MAG: NAD-dependent epimerase/dehydratase family protein [Rubripirellula sp.]
MTHALVTGATGFVGHHLVKRLNSDGVDVTCLVRGTSKRSKLESLGVSFAIGDVTDAESLPPALVGVDVVYHVAGLTKSLDSKEMECVNEQGVRNVAKACADQPSPPVLVVVSSLAASGPSQGSQPKRESEPCRPISVYGRSKRAGELAAFEFADRVPTTIVRPPIVLGEEDADGFQLFGMLRKMRFHLVPSFSNHHFSVIHADDLALALSLAAEKGSRLSTDPNDATGVYFASADEILTYSELGRMIGRSVGRPRAWMIHVPMPAVWATGGFNELLAKVQRKPNILNLDKAREAAAGSWVCTSERLKQDTGYRPEKTLPERLQQTVEGYQEKGWIKITS